MQVIVGERKTGKTTKLLELMRENPTMVMVCVNARMVDYCRTNNRDIDPDRFITVERVRQGRLFGARVDLVIDDVDQLIYDYFRTSHTIRAVSITED